MSNCCHSFHPTCQSMRHSFNKWSRVRDQNSHHTEFDAPPSSLMDSTTNPKMKIAEGEGVGVHSLIHNTSGVSMIFMIWEIWTYLPSPSHLYPLKKGLYLPRSPFHISQGPLGQCSVIELLYNKFEMTLCNFFYVM